MFERFHPRAERELREINSRVVVGMKSIEEACVLARRMVEHPLERLEYKVLSYRRSWLSWANSSLRREREKGKFGGEAVSIKCLASDSRFCQF